MSFVLSPIAVYGPTYPLISQFLPITAGMTIYNAGNKDGDSAKLEAYVEIITDSSTPFTMSAFKTYIINTLNSGGRFVASGTYWDATNGVCFIHSLYKSGGYASFSAHKQNTTMMAGSSYLISIGSDYSNLHITDTVITL